MKFKHQPQGHTIDVLFTLALFCVFAASALAVVVIGANVYKHTSQNMTSTFSERTAMAYIEQKFRQNDTLDAISAAKLSGRPALVIKQSGDNGNFITYIYCYNNNLCEIFTREGMSVSPEMGQQLLPINDFTVQEKDGVFTFTATSVDGTVSSLSLTSQCG